MAIDPTDGIKNGLVILTVVVLNTVIGFVQEFRASKAIEALSKMVPENVTVVRQGTKSTARPLSWCRVTLCYLPVATKCQPICGWYTSAIFKSRSALTGESVPTEKTLSAVDLNAGLGDQTCMASAAHWLYLRNRHCRCRRDRAKTELGKISSMLRETTDLQTPLTQSLARIGKNITVAIIAISVLMLGVGSYRAIHETGTELLPAIRETAIFAISLAGGHSRGPASHRDHYVAIGVHRMGRASSGDSQLPAVETLGSTTSLFQRQNRDADTQRNDGSGRLDADLREARSACGYEPKGVIAKEARKSRRAQRFSGSALAEPYSTTAS